MGEPMDRSKRAFVQFDSTFEQAFPTLDDAMIRFTEEFGYGEKTRPGKWSYREKGGLMPCWNSKCRRGGYEFDFIIRGMIREQVGTQKIELSCPGDEGSLKGRKRGDPCMCSIEGTITLIPRSAD